jgi:hypothetical protein
MHDGNSMSNNENDLSQDNLLFILIKTEESRISNKETIKDP